MNTFDIDDIKIEKEGTDMQILHPATGEPLWEERTDEETGKVSSIPVTLQLVGQDSDIYKKISNRITNKRVKMKAGRLTAERMDSDTAEIIEGCTVGWSSNLVLSGAAPANAKEIYQGRKWLRDQAEQHIHDRANYLGN